MTIKPPQENCINVIIFSKNEGVITRLREALTLVYRDQYLSQIWTTIDEVKLALLAKHHRNHITFIDDPSVNEGTLKSFSTLSPDSVFLSCAHEDSAFKGRLGPLIVFEYISAEHAGVLLPKIVRRMEVSGKLPNIGVDRDEYVSVKVATILEAKTVAGDVYIKMGDLRYVRVFKKGDAVTKEDIERYRHQKAVTEFYFKKLDETEIVSNIQGRLEELTYKPPFDEVELEKTIVNSQELIRDLVTELGFNEEAQKLAKANVAAALKLIGSKPKLSNIWKDLKSKEGQYISSHSIVLAKLCCAIAYKVGWSSESTFSKLTMASFLHDIALSNEKIAKESSYPRAEKSGRFSADELKEMKLHTSRAADYARQFSEISSEVEQIVSQHHERPDGTGFPRGLSAQHLNPLCSLFIIAHDMIEFSAHFPDTPMDSFFSLKEQEYGQGIFRKIFIAVKRDAHVV